MRTSDFLIIGAGIAGASAAYELARYGSVTVLEREHTPGYHSTGRSAAMYMETYGVPVIRALTIGSLSFFETPPTDLVGSPILSPRGVLWIGCEEQRAVLEKAYQEFRALVPSVRWLDAEEAHALCPVLNRALLGGAVQEPNARDLDVNEIHQCFLRGLRARGGEVVCNAEVTALRRTDGTWTADTLGETYSAPILFNAAGAWCDEVARLAGVLPLGLVPYRRTAFVFDPPSHMTTKAFPMVANIAEEFYFKPDAGRMLGSLAEETVVPPCDARPEDLDVAMGVDRLEQATEFRIPRVVRSWAGLRTFAPDRGPVVGMDEQAEGFFWLAGQGGYGIMTSPAVARLVSGLATGQGVPADLAALGVQAAAVAPARLKGQGCS